MVAKSVVFADHRMGMSGSGRNAASLVDLEEETA